MGKLLPDLLGPAAVPINLDFDGVNGARFTGAVVVLVSNNPYQFARLDAMATRPRLDAGVLGIQVAVALAAPSATRPATAARRASGRPVDASTAATPIHRRP